MGATLIHLRGVAIGGCPQAGTARGGAGSLQVRFSRYFRTLGKWKAMEKPQQWDCRKHFYAAAAEAMRRILVDSTRRKQSIKRGGDLVRQDLDGVDIASPQTSEDVVALDAALEKLARTDEQASELIKLR